MHDKITTVIPGSQSQSQVKANSLVSSKESISELMPEIRSIYEKIIKKDNHDLWD